MLSFTPPKKIYKVLASKREIISRQSRGLIRSRDYTGYKITSLEVAIQTQEKLQLELEDKLDASKYPYFATVNFRSPQIEF